MKRNVNNVTAGNQFKFRRIREYVSKELEKEDIHPLTDIWVYQDEGWDWHAVFGGYFNDEPVAFVFSCVGGIIEIEPRPAIRFRPNGSLEYS